MPAFDYLGRPSTDWARIHQRIDALLDRLTASRPQMKA